MILLSALSEPQQCILIFRSSCLWQRGRGWILVIRKSRSANLQHLRTPRRPIVTMRYGSCSCCHISVWDTTNCFSYLMNQTAFFAPLSSGLWVAPKAKRRLSLGKVLRRRMQQRRRLIKQRRRAAQMETAQLRALRQRRVRRQL